MADYRLTKKEGNAVYAIAEGIGLRPSDFDLSYETNVVKDILSVLLHAPTSHRFKFGVFTNTRGGTLFHSRWSPLIENRTDQQHTYRVQQIECAGVWLHAVKEEHETVDLWKVAAEEAALVSGGHIDDGDRPFSAREVQVLTERLTLLEQKIIELAQPTPEQRVHLSVTIQHAKDASSRTSRLDWKSLFVGKLFDIVVSLGLDPAKAQQVLHYATLYVGPLVSKVIGLLQ